MSDHLPECEYPDPEMLPGECPTCRLLRACEARVREEEHAKWSDLAHDNWQDGWGEGLDAARDAVAAEFPLPRYQSEHDSALAAINALRGES